MAWTPLATRLDSGAIPLVLAGPILRRVDSTHVTVFLALRQPLDVRLDVYQGTTANAPVVATGTALPLSLGDNLHLVTVTATTTSGALAAATTYAYNVTLDPDQTALSLLSPNTLAVNSVVALGYGGAALPTFAYPPANVASLNLVHGSCRKPHAPSQDALAALDEMLTLAGADASDPAYAKARPHVLLLTGDQIYADDVADALLFMLIDAASALLGWSEDLPTTPSGPPPAPGAREPLTHTIGLTSDVAELGKDLTQTPKSHLLTFGEFACMYLFAWSTALWPADADLPTRAQVATATGQDEFDKEVGRLRLFRGSIDLVRKGLANVSTYMVFDDHEITDDVFMIRRWVSAPLTSGPIRYGALADPVGRRLIQNALSAYAVFQAWGNTPEAFDTPGSDGAALLEALTTWTASLATDATPATAVAAACGVPTGVLGPTDRSLTLAASALPWHYQIALPGADWEILFLDCRLHRDYPLYPSTRARPTRPEDLLFAGLLSAGAVQKQISAPASSAATVLSFVVSQTPLLGVQGVEDHQRDVKDVFNNDAEAWALDKTGFQRVVAALAQRRQRVVVLAGDVHYTFAARMAYRATTPFGATAALAGPLLATIVQLTSSSVHNEGDTFWGSGRLHEGGYNQFYVQDMGTNLPRAGWLHRSAARVKGNGQSSTAVPAVDWTWDEEPVVASWSDGSDPADYVGAPDWRYRLRLVPGEKAVNTTLPHLDTVPADPVAAKAQCVALPKAYYDQVGRDRGHDVVGVNNLCDVHVTVDNAGLPTQVVQRSWWRPAPGGSLVPATVFTLALTLDVAP